MKKILILCFGLVLSASCGKVSSDQQQDAANLMGGLAGSNNGSSSALRDSDAETGLGTAIRQIRDQAMGQIWLNQFGYTESSNLTLSSCPTTTAPGCTMSCPTTSSIKAACTFPDGTKSTCGGTQYSFTAASMTATIDFTNLSGSVGSSTGSFSLSMSFSANVSGGKLEGKTLACNMAFTIDVAKAKAKTQAFVPSCDNFSCTYDGSAISCSDLQAKMGSANSCS